MLLSMKVFFLYKIACKKQSQEWNSSGDGLVLKTDAVPFCFVTPLGHSLKKGSHSTGSHGPFSRTCSLTLKRTWLR